jgi:hypothetical protein
MENKAAATAASFMVNERRLAKWLERGGSDCECDGSGLLSDECAE